MPDFTLKNNFPMEAVITAAQRKAALEQQARTEGNQQLIQGLQAIGQVGQSLVERRQKIAQALALGKQFDIPDDVARTMDPSQIVQVATIKKGQIDINMLMNLLHPGFSPNPAATPTSGTATPAPASNGAMLTGGPSPSPQPVQQPSASPTPSIPVPVPVPPIAPPKMVNPATMNAAIKIAGQQVPVMTTGEALAKGHVQKGTVIKDEKGNFEDPKEQNKLEQQYRNVLLKPLSNRSGGLGLEDAKVNQAIHLRTLVNKFYDPKSGSYSIPPSMHAELALGLARLQSPTGQVGIELVKELRQATAREGLAGALIYLGADPHTVGGTTQSVSRLFIDSIDRQGSVSEANREQYMDYLRSLKPTGLDESRAERLEKGKLNSFGSLLKASPDQLHQESIDLGTVYSDSEKEKRFQAYKARQSR